VNWLILAIVGFFAYPIVLKPSLVKLVARLPPAPPAPPTADFQNPNF
jgi:hypothetical protein